MKARFAFVALGVVLFGAAGLTMWYHQDRTAMLATICKVGLPNLSRPSEVDADELGCAILARKAVYRGVLITGFEASNFSSPDFPRVPGELYAGDSRSWFRRTDLARSKVLDEQLDRTYFQQCISGDRSEGSGFASLKAEGWVTVSGGRFGHLDQYPREFYAGRITQVGPPPKKLIDDWIAGYRRANLCDDQVAEWNARRE